jgi:hypothetical protein
VIREPPVHGLAPSRLVRADQRYGFGLEIVQDLLAALCAVTLGDPTVRQS